MRDRGVITRPLGDVVILMPPLGIAEPELQQMASALNHGLDQVYGAASSWLEQHAEQRRAAGCTAHRDRANPVVTSRPTTTCLARDHDVIEAGVTALRRWGPARPDPGWSAGHTALHAELESALSNLVDAERTLVFVGLSGQPAAITALTDADTLLLSDAYNHASIVDACRPS